MPRSAPSPGGQLEEDDSVSPVFRLASLLRSCSHDFVVILHGNLDPLTLRQGTVFIEFG